MISDSYIEENGGRLVKSIFRRSASTLSAFILCLWLSLVGPVSALATPDLTGCLSDLDTTGACTVTGLDFFVKTVTPPAGYSGTPPPFRTLVILWVPLKLT